MYRKTLINTKFLNSKVCFGGPRSYWNTKKITWFIKIPQGQGDSRRRMIERKYVCNNSEKMSLGRRTRLGNLTMYHPPVAPRRCQPPPTQQRNLSFLEARISHIWLLSPLQLNKKYRQKNWENYICLYKFGFVATNCENGHMWDNRQNNVDISVWPLHPHPRSTMCKKTSILAEGSFPITNKLGFQWI